MNTIKKVLVPVDFSNSATTAINYALGMAKSDRNMAFTLIYVNQPDAPSDITKKDLDNLREEIFVPEWVSCDTIYESGDLAEVLIETRNKMDIDLIVMGTSGVNEESRPTNTIELLRKADCPVLVVPENTKGFTLNNIALAMDDQQFDNASDLSLLHDFARWHKATVHLLTVDRETEPHEVKLGAQSQTIEYYMDNLDYRHSFPKNTDIEQGIKDYVKEKKIDVLAIMPRHHAKNSEPSEGRLTQVLAGHSEVPLLILD